MIDILPTIATLISGVCRVEEQFPDSSATFPMATICEVNNSSTVALSGADRLSLISFQIDVWDNSSTGETCANTALAINAIITAKGFKRLNSPTIPDQLLHRKTLTYAGNIDEQNNYVYGI